MVYSSKIDRTYRGRKLETWKERKTKQQHSRKRGDSFLQLVLSCTRVVDAQKKGERGDEPSIVKP